MRRDRLLGVLVVCGVLTVYAGAAAAQPNAGMACSCPVAGDPDDPGGIVWRGSGALPTLPEIARRVAPVLWFSGDEPLLVRGGAARVPGPHPCDTPGTGPIVYYQVLEVVLRGEEEVGDPETDTRFFDKVDRLVLKFFFYYDEDIGVGSHTHDLEAIESGVILDLQPNGCSQIRLDRVEALAHGIRWYSNVLDLQPDTVLPLSILVEEGKHASCPDRNADGIFTPGYDVNERVNDAWGVRDVMGSGAVLGTSFSSSMAKVRDAAFRLTPPPSDAACSGARGPARLAQSPGLGQYELRPASAVPRCPLVGREAGRLADMMDTTVSARRRISIRPKSGCC